MTEPRWCGLTRGGWVAGGLRRTLWSRLWATGAKRRAAAGGSGGRPPEVSLLGSGGPAAGQRGAAAAEVQHGHGDERFGIAVTEGDALQEPDLGVHAFHP